jgi:molybdate transport system substrate-binding protein
LGNRLVIIAPADSELTLQTLQDLATAPIARLALADPAAVPAGIYARQALLRQELWQVLESKIVAGADVRQALAYVAQGAADAGIVYATDASATARVKVVLKIPSEAHDPIRYPLVLLKAAEGNAAAQSLFADLQSPEAAALFRQHGFETPAAESPLAESPP